MPVTRCVDPEAAETALAAIRDAEMEAVFLFFGSEEPASGASWCPDCVTADPVLRAACATRRPDLTLHECPVGRRADWKDRPQHPYRLHPLWRLERIPTLVHVCGCVELGRLVEADCADPAVVAAFLQQEPA